ncbi:MAG: alpha/beta hydrolase domain-containing protein [Microthrixaceae bacterium]
MEWFVPVGLAVIALVVPVPASAGPANDGQLPTSVAPPPAGNGVPLASATVAGAPDAVDLAAQGYVEEEFIVAGTANVYRYGADRAVEVDREGVPYATRILIRRPESPRRFSGNVHVETSHPQLGVNVVWSQTFEYLLANGDAYVSITTRRTNNGFSAIEGLKAFDPVRYAPLDFTEDGLNWDIIGQVGRLLKTETADNPLRDFDVERLYASGWSGGGALLLLYISDGFHDRARMPDGAPVFDGYLVGEPSGYPRINSTAPELPESDERQPVQPRDVPAISLHTRPQEEFRRRPDGDRRNDRYRVYEVAGAAHADVRAIGVGDVGCTYEISRFPMHHLFKSTLERLDAWAAGDETPPRSKRLTLEGDGSAKLDDNGNPLGGVRTTYTEVPTARYVAENPGGAACERFGGGQEPFPPEQLASLYESHDDYVRKVTRLAKRLERDGWLLPADARAVRDEAAGSDIP